MGRAKETRQALLDAVIALVAQGGPDAATTQAIAASVGVTEGAIYRHFRSKDELRWAAYRSVVERMIAEKETLASSDVPFREIMERWIDVTYRSFDESPESFAYIFLRPQPEYASAENKELMGRQSNLLLQCIKVRQKSGEIRNAPAEILRSHFTGMMLNIPRSIEDGTLPGPAQQYTDEVTKAAWRVFRHSTSPLDDDLNRSHSDS